MVAGGHGGFPARGRHAAEPERERAGPGTRCAPASPRSSRTWRRRRASRRRRRCSKLGVVSSLSVAIEGHDEPFGVLNVNAREPRDFSEDEVEFLTAIATLIIIAVERDRGEQVTRHAALHDPLTGLPNRTLALDRLAQALARRRRERIDVAVFVLDVDGFKLINDSLGHAAGDEVLLALAPRLTAAVRTTDTVARLGGDEFVVICPDVDAARGATDVAERLAAAVTRPLSLDSGEHFFTVSVGGTLAGDASSTPRSRCCGDADAAMYRAKARGRGALRAVRRGDAHQPDRARAHRDRAAPRARPRRARGLLPAGHRPRERPPGVDRGARALAAPRARADPAARLHPDRRGDRPDRRCSGCRSSRTPAARPRSGSATSTRRSACRSTSPGARCSTRCSPRRWRRSPSTAGCAPGRSRSRSPRRC